MHRLATALALLVLALSGCASEPDDDTPSCAGGKCDSLAELDKPDSEIEESQCDGLLLDMSGRPENSRVAGRLNDPFARIALRQGSCPGDFRSIVEKLNDGQEDCSVSTHVISEDASTLQMALSEEDAIANSSYRTVTARQCDDKDSPEILFSQFGVTTESGAPDDVEIVAFDDSVGVFNYYKLHSDGTFGFFGNSADFLLRGSGDTIELDDGEETNERDCARCHNSGGLVMKELESPWVHWQQSRLVGADLIVENNADLYGEIHDAPKLEKIVKQANGQWNAKRLNIISEQAELKELLRPLFCPVEIQVEVPGTAGDYNLVNSTLGSVIPSDFDFDAFGAYESLKVELEQRMFSTMDIDVDDTSQGSTQLARSFVDRDYVRRLVEARLIDDEFRRSVLMVDFTRPVFSEDRCKLLELTPQLAISDDEEFPNELRNAFIHALEGKTGAARELRRNLIATQGGNARTFFRARIDAFASACEDRASEGDGTDFLRDVMTYLSLQRSRARERQIIEFAGSLAFDFFESEPGEGTSLIKKLRLSPKSCNLVSRFTATADPAPDE